MFLRDHTCFQVPFRHFAQTLKPEDELEAVLFPEACSASFLNESCDCDLEDELLRKSANKPGTTGGTKLSVLQMILFPFWGQSWLLTADPLIGVSAVFAKLAERWDSKRFLE